MTNFVKLRSVILLMTIVSATMGLAGCCPRNPALNTAVAAHGNTDWHIDTANEFLYGKDMAGNTTAANHCPDSWTKQHIHVGATNTAHYYYDSSKTSPGDDKDSTSGIDHNMLFFYAGHGNPTIWNTLGNNGTQSNCLLGNCASNLGGVRYYWQCSCEVFAHGPYTCAGGGLEYSCPGSFDGSADSASMRNVYQRWGPALSSELRMACGASTLAYCHETQANRIWNNYNNLGLDVADSLIQGLSGSGVVPLCITLGGADVTLTPLYDVTFTNAANSSGTSYYHIQYASSFARQPTSPTLIVVAELPILKVRPLPLPEPYKNMKFERSNEDLVSSDVGELKASVKVKSGSIYLVAKQRKPQASSKLLDESQYISLAKEFLKKQGLSEENTFEPIGSKMMVQSQMVKGSEPSKTMVKSLVLNFRRFIEVNGTKVPVIGDGGTIEVSMNPDGSIIQASKVWREIVSQERQATIKTHEAALAEANRKLGDVAQFYKVEREELGYKELDGAVEQNELKAVYHFNFVPKDKETMLKYPPRMVEISAQFE